MMQSWQSVWSKPKDRRIASLLAVASVFSPVSGLHKFYLKQPVGGVVYLLLSWTPIPRAASAFEAIWYLFQDPDMFNLRFNADLSAVPAVKQSTALVDPEQVGAIADAVRTLDQLRSDGLISEYEFEQKRRSLLDKMG